MARRLQLSESNPVMAAIQGYKAVDDIFETNRQRKRAEEDRSMAIADRERQMKWQDKVQAQTEQTWSQQNEAYAAQQALLQDAKTQRHFQELKLMQQQGAKPDQLAQAFQQMPPESKESLKKFFPPGAAAQMKAYGRLFNEGAANGDIDSIVESMNAIYGAEINQGGAREGVSEILEKKIVSAYFHEDGSVTPVLEITAKDNKGNPIKYTAPATVGQGAGDQDQVLRLTPEQVGQNVFERVQWADIIERGLVSTGDTGPLERAETRGAAIEKNQWTTKASDAVIKAYDPAVGHVENLANLEAAAMGVVKKSQGALQPAEAMAIVANYAKAHSADMTLAQQRKAALGETQEGDKPKMNWKDSLNMVNKALENMAEVSTFEESEPQRLMAEERTMYQMRNAIRQHPEEFITTYGENQVGKLVIAELAAEQIVDSGDIKGGLDELRNTPGAEDHFERVYSVFLSLGFDPYQDDGPPGSDETPAIPATPNRNSAADARNMQTAVEKKQKQAQQRERTPGYNMIDWFKTEWPKRISAWRQEMMRRGQQ